MSENEVKNFLSEKWDDIIFLAPGGNSWVFKSEKNKIAIKVFRRFGNGDRYTRFIEEVKYAKSLADIQGVVPILDSNDGRCESISSLKDVPYFLMPLYQKTLVASFVTTMKDNGMSAVETTLKIAYIIRDIHNKKCAHRDLKPENILLDDSNNLFVSDYGLCIDLNNLPTPESRSTGDQELIGSVLYRAPELLRGRLDGNDHRPCDVFSLGRILWSLIHGKQPEMLTDLEFEATSVLDCSSSIRKPKNLDDIIQGATNVNPKYRMDISTFIQSLENWINDTDSGSVEDIVSKIVNKPAVMAIAQSSQQLLLIQDAHSKTKEFLIEEMGRITSSWHEISSKYQAETKSGNLSSISCSSGYSVQFSPAAHSYGAISLSEPEVIRCRFNLGNSTVPLIDLSLYIAADFDKWENQKYQIVGGYFLPNDTVNSYLVVKPEIITFDYRSSGIRQEIVQKLEKCFSDLNKILVDAL